MVVNQFRQYLKNNDIGMYENQLEGEIQFSQYYNLNNGGTTVLYVIFSDEYDNLYVGVENVAKIINPATKSRLQKLLEHLSSQYDLIFYENEDLVHIYKVIPDLSLKNIKPSEIVSLYNELLEKANTYRPEMVDILLPKPE